jgi:hypothetical protein
MEITEEIIKCSHCKTNVNVIVRPFYFKIRKQPIMLISACPSIQTVYKPITSVRFFRQLCASLLGNNGITEDAIREFNTGNIYWTHYHKCYFSEGDDKDRLNNLPEICAKKYLLSELLQLKDNLKIIIVIGETIRERVGKIIKEAKIDTGIVRYVDFPHLAKSEIYRNLEEKIKPHLKYEYKRDDKKYTKHSLSYTTLNSVHMEFEFELLKRYAEIKNPINALNLSNAKDIDDLWYNNVIIPIQQKQMFVVQCYGFIENQIKAFLYARMNDEILKKTIDDVATTKCFNELKGMERFHNAVQLKWQLVFKKYVSNLNNSSSFSYHELEKSVKSLSGRIDNLRKIRHLFTHQNGFVKPNGDYFDTTEKKDVNIKNYFYLAEKKKAVEIKTRKFNGMHVFVNLLYVDEQGCKEVLEIAKELKEIIKRVEDIEL